MFSWRNSWGIIYYVDKQIHAKIILLVSSYYEVRPDITKCCPLIDEWISIYTRWRWSDCFQGCIYFATTISPYVTHWVIQSGRGTENHIPTVATCWESSHIKTWVSKPFPIRIYLNTDLSLWCGQIKMNSVHIHLFLTGKKINRFYVFTLRIHFIFDAQIFISIEYSVSETWG